MSNGLAKEDFDLDAVIAEVKHKPFRFTFAGRKWTLPHLGDLDVWQLVDAAEQGDLAAAVEVFKTGLGEDWEEFRSHPMPQHAMNALFERYQKHAGMKPGE